MTDSWTLLMIGCLWSMVDGVIWISRGLIFDLKARPPVCSKSSHADLGWELCRGDTLKSHTPHWQWSQSDFCLSSRQSIHRQNEVRERPRRHQLCRSYFETWCWSNATRRRDFWESWWLHKQCLPRFASLALGKAPVSPHRCTPCIKH